MPSIGIQDPVPDSAPVKQVLNSTVDFLNSADILGTERVSHSHILRSHHDFEFYSLDHYECRGQVGAFECSHRPDCRGSCWWHCGAFFAIAILINFLVRRNQLVNRDGGVENVDLTRDEGALASTSTVEGWWEVK